MMESSENNNESQKMITIDYGDQALLEDYEEIPRVSERRAISGKNRFLTYNAPPMHWCPRNAKDPKDYEDLLSNPNREAERNLREQAIHEIVVNLPNAVPNLTNAIRKRHNSLGRDATEEERNDPHGIGLLMLRHGKTLFRTSRRLSRRLGLMHPDLPDGRVGFYAQQRFGRDGGELQDLWYTLYVLRTELENPGLRAIAQALHYAHIWGPHGNLEED